MDECLVYFRKAVTDPATVPPWSEWWAANAELVAQVFSLVDYVRLKHRRLRGARQILQIAGELPEDFCPPSALESGSCAECGERTTRYPGPGGGIITCPNCGVVCQYETAATDDGSFEER
jgi:hypothetical protein